MLQWTSDGYWLLYMGMADASQQESPLSIAANVAGILTFELRGSLRADHVRYLRNNDQEYFRVKTSLSWYKTESAWLAELVRVMHRNQANQDGQDAPKSPGARGGSMLKL
ncbi:hypothetical protein SLS62_003818 [Diatrype stigma]|uniref:Uncharacterized protein n=1 Tax=Diatrype stigma TaxID=117547 RepID=A0AAN9UXV4_9PEZI